MRSHDNENASDDLRRYVRAILARKELIAAICFSTASLAGAWCLFAPKTYEVSMVIEPPVMALTDSGVQSLDTVENIAATIDQGSFDWKIIRELNLPDKELRFYITQPRGTKLLRVGVRRRGEEAGLGIEILKHLKEALDQGYEAFVKQRRSRIDNQIQTISSQIAAKESEIRMENNRLKILEDRETQLLEELRLTKENSEKMLVKREALLGQKDGRDDISSLLYTSTIQQNISYSTQLQNQLSNLRIDKQKAMTVIEGIRSAIIDGQIEINNLNLQKNSIANIVMVQKPEVSLMPVGIGKRQAVFAGAAVGLALGLFYVFMIECWGFQAQASSEFAQN